VADKRVLILIDNCEHVVSGSAAFCESILERCHQLRIIATSREPLGVGGEARWPVPPLSESDAMSLFEQRGQHVDPSFNITAANQGEVTDICRRLDELPLAIELAASRLGMMSERQISTQLADRFSVLTSKRSSDPRHQTMLAAIDWSHRLLNEQETVLFRRLAIFRGGFMLESAQAVCSDSLAPDVFASLSGLVEKSMVAVESVDGEARYRLLESQAVYAEEKLRASGESDDVRSRHYDYFTEGMVNRTAGLTGSMSEIFAGPAEVAWKRRELGNFWAAAQWARRHRKDMGMRLASGIGFMEFVDLEQMRSLLTELIRDAPPGAGDRVALLSAARNLAMRQGDVEGALEIARSLVEFIVPRPDRPWRDTKAMALNSLGTVLAQSGQFEAAESAFHEATELAKNSENRRLHAALQHSFGILELVRHNPRPARDILANALALAIASGHPQLHVSIRESLANAELACDDVDSAEQSWRTSLRDSRRIELRSNGIACLGGLARVATVRQDHVRALRLGAAHDHLCQELLFPEHPYWQTELDMSRDISRAKLGPVKSTQAWKQGLSMDLERAFGYALNLGEGAPIFDSPLSRREVDVARLVATGTTNREIAAKLFLSERTVEGHVERIRNKLGVRSRSEVATWAFEHGLTETES